MLSVRQYTIIRKIPDNAARGKKIRLVGGYVLDETHHVTCVTVFVVIP